MHRLLHKKWLYFFISILIYSFIIANSLSNADKSHELSNNTSGLITLFFNFIGLRDVEIPHLIIRKSAHITEYFALGFFISLAYKTFFNDIKLMFSSGLFLCFSLASFDEFTQCFVPGRAGKITDIFIDSIGFIIAIGLIFILSKKKSPHY